MQALYKQAQDLYSRYLLGLISRAYYKKEAQTLIDAATNERDREALLGILGLK